MGAIKDELMRKLEEKLSFWIKYNNMFTSDAEDILNSSIEDQIDWMDWADKQEEEAEELSLEQDREKELNDD